MKAAEVARLGGFVLVLLLLGWALTVIVVNRLHVRLSVVCNIPGIVKRGKGSEDFVMVKGCCFGYQSVIHRSLIENLALVKSCRLEQNLREGSNLQYVLGSRLRVVDNNCLPTLLHLDLPLSLSTARSSTCVSSSLVSPPP